MEETGRLGTRSWDQVLKPHLMFVGFLGVREEGMLHDEGAHTGAAMVYVPWYTGIAHFDTSKPNQFCKTVVPKPDFDGQQTRSWCPLNIIKPHHIISLNHVELGGDLIQRRNDMSSDPFAQPP